MKTIKWEGMIFLIGALAVCLSTGVRAADETSYKTADKTIENKTADKTDMGDWRVTLGGTCSRPKLTRANRDIHAAELQLRQTAPSAEKFEDWDDILKGTFRIGISRRLDINNLKLWPDLYVAYGSGYVETKQSGLPTIYAVSMDYRFKQTYDFYQFNLGTFAELFELKGLSVTLGGYLTYGLLSSGTAFSTSIPALSTMRHVKGNFREGAFGYAAVCNFYYEPDFLKGLGLTVSARYDWLRFKGSTKIDDYQSSPLGTIILNYDQHSVSDMTGPSVFFGVSYRF